jgi:hypothetical protein
MENKPTKSFNQTEYIIQNYCVTFSHQINYKYSRIQNSFVIKAANVTEEKALKIANILFEPPLFTNIEIVSIKNDENTLTPEEYQFLYDMLCNRRQSDMRCAEERISNGISTEPYIETEGDKYIFNLIQKMKTRMSQFPTYHT